MTKATKQKLSQLNSTINVLSSEQDKKNKTIMLLAVGISAVILIVLFVILGRKKR